MQEIQDISEKHAQRGLNDNKKRLENEIDEFEFSKQDKLPITKDN